MLYTANSISTNSKRIIAVQLKKLNSNYNIKLSVFEDGFYLPSNIIDETKPLNGLNPTEIIDKYINKLMEGLEFNTTYNYILE